MTWCSRLGDNLASRWSGRGSTYGRGNFIFLFWPFWFCLFVCLFVCLFPSPIGWFQFIHIAVVFTFQMKMPKKNRKRNESYQVDQWRSLKTEISLGTTLQSGFLPILGDPGADSGGEGKSKRAEKYGTKKSKERWEEPLGTMSYQTNVLLFSPFFTFLRAILFLPFRHSLAPTICPWVSEDVFFREYSKNRSFVSV